MSQRPIGLSPDLRRLRDEGYNIEIREGHLLVKDVPYVNEKREVARGTLVAVLTLNGDIAQPPADHLMYFDGDYPCNKDGSRITGIHHQSSEQELAKGVQVKHSFSSKPPGGKYADYYEKMTTYVGILSHPAAALDPKATPMTFPVVTSDGEDSVFHYIDSASSRAGVTAVADKLAGRVVAIVGLGGTGAYILDLVAKTHVREIHLYDGDVFLQHNAFRAPGAASIADLTQHAKKVDYYADVYSRMRRGVVPHPYFLDGSNAHELAGAGFVFLSLDAGEGKRGLITQLQVLEVPYVDCGIGVYKVDGRLAGIVRATTSTIQKNDHVQKYISITDGEDNEYARNIQIADLSALNAALAVIKWKKHCGFYNDLENEHHTTYTIDGNALMNEEFP